MLIKLLMIGCLIGLGSAWNQPAASSNASTCSVRTSSCSAVRSEYKEDIRMIKDTLTSITSTLQYLGKYFVSTINIIAKVFDLIAVSLFVCVWGQLAIKVLTYVDVCVCTFFIVDQVGDCLAVQTSPPIPVTTGPTPTTPSPDITTTPDSLNTTTSIEPEMPTGDPPVTPTPAMPAEPPESSEPPVPMSTGAPAIMSTPGPTIPPPL